MRGHIRSVVPKQCSAPGIQRCFEAFEYFRCLDYDPGCEVGLGGERITPMILPACRNSR